MGLLRWIKKEIDATNSSKRRQSDPTMSKKILNPSMLRDEAYLQALAKFNEWRIKQTLSTTMDNNNTSNQNLTNLHRIDRRCTIHVHGNTSLKRNDLETVNECASGSDNFKDSVSEQKSITSITEKLTRCNSSRISIHKEEQLTALQTLDEWVVKQTKVNPICVDNDKEVLNIYEEIQSFQSPSAIMNNSVPLRKHKKDKDVRLVSFYENTQNDDTQSANYSNPPDEFFRRNSNPFSQIKSPSSKTAAAILDKSCEEEKVKASGNKGNSSILKATTRQCRKNSQNATHAKVKEVPKGNKLSKSNNFVTSYQRVVNKHGDLVEYAVPLVDQSGNLSSRDVSNRYDEIIDENFCFLNENKIVTSNVLVTDLDNSEANPKNNTEHEHDGIFEELTSLENWSANINAADRNISERSYHEPVPQCGIQDIHESIITSTIRNNFKCTLEMVKGKFHKSAITIRRATPNDNVVAREALDRDYRVLSQIRHSDIVLLMAACVERNNKTIVSLVYEPVQCTLNYLIHNNEEKISVNNCINYGLQISKAILYLHENGFVHSNVMSHNILMCEYKNCVKLSSFELAIDINYNARNEIITKGLNHIQSSPMYNNDSGSNCWSRAQHVIAKEKLPNIFLPYNVFYRQAFTKHCYQAPELLTTTSNFVFPTHLCDIYGISLTLWEMIAREVPYNHYSLSQLTKNFHKNRNVCSLNMPKYDFMEYFQTIFDYGLRAEPDKRIQTMESFIELLESTQNRYLAHLKREKLTKNIDAEFECGNSSTVLGTPKTLIKQQQEGSQKNITLEDTSISTFATPLAPQQRGSLIYERTSTLKRPKRRNIQSDNVPENKQDVNGNFLQNANTRNSNQVNALLNLKQISKSLDSIFDKCIVDTLASTPSTTSQNKSYKFEIGEFLLPNTPIARRNKILKNAWLADVPVGANMMYKKIDKEQCDEELVKKESPNSVISNNKPSLSCNRLCINIKIVNRTNAPHSGSPQSPQPVKVICSAESKEKSIQMTDTPKTSRMQRRINISENKNVRVNLFDESFSVSKNDKSTPTESLVAVESITERFPKKDESVRNYEFENILWKREKDKCEAVSPKTKELRSNSAVITPKRASVKEFINKFECLNKSEPRIRTTSVLLNNETRKFNKTNSNVKMNDSDVPIPIPIPMSFNKSEDHGKYDGNENKPEAEQDAIVKAGPSQPPNLETLKHGLLAVNMKKLNRRASDVIHLRKRNQTNQISNLQTRHSLCGSDLTQSFGKIIYINNDKIEKFLTEKNILKSDDVMTIRPKDDHTRNSAKLSCWNCGSCVFLIGKTSDIERNLLTKSISNNQTDITLPKNARNILATKSIEDLYIDDDFCEGLEIGANMELGNGNDRSDILDLLGDMDCFPVEIQN